MKTYCETEPDWYKIILYVEVLSYIGALLCDTELVDIIQFVGNLSFLP